MKLSLSSFSVSRERSVVWALALATLALCGPAHAQIAHPAARPNSAPVSTGPALLVVTKQSHALAIIDADTLKVRATVPIGEDPHEVLVLPDGRTAVVSNFGEGTLETLARVDLVHASALPAWNIAPLAGAHGLALHNQRLWITAVASKAIARLDPVTGHIVEVLGTGQDNTHMLWISRDGRRILASNAGSATMSVFDRVDASEPQRIPGAPPPPASYIHADWRHTLLPTGAKAEGFGVSPDEHEAWVGNDDGTVTILDLQHMRVAATIDPGAKGANRLQFTPDGTRVVETTHTGKDLIVFDAHTRAVVKRVPIEERGASGIQFAPGGGRVFIACPRDHFVAVVDMGTLTRVATIDAGREPDGLAWWNGAPR